MNFLPVLDSQGEWPTMIQTLALDFNVWCSVESWFILLKVQSDETTGSQTHVPCLGV